MLQSLALLLFAARIEAQFNLYPSVPSAGLASALNISDSCLSALNATVDCDQDLFSMAGNVDGFFWSDENATALCTSECLDSAKSWWNSAGDACEDDTLNAYGRIYPANTVSGRFVDGLNVVCLTANTNILQDVGLNGTLVASNGSTNDTSNATYPYPWLAQREETRSSYCLVQSYGWAGSDIIRPDCSDSANVNASQCIDPTDVPPENERIANLYPDDLLCSSCFLNMYYLRLASPYLPDSDYSEYLAQQWYDIVDVCNANSSVPELVVRDLPFYDWAPGDAQNQNANATSYLPEPSPLTGNQTYNETCPYGVVEFANLNITVDSGDICGSVAKYFSVPQGEVFQMFSSVVCQPSFNTTEIPAICKPQTCELDLMPANTTCTEFASSLSSGNVSVPQFLSWNPFFVGLCDNTTEQQVCVGAPGGTYVSPAASNSSTSASTQQRGGGDGSGTATGSGGVGGGSRNSTTIAVGGTPPSPVQSGIAASCTQFAKAQSGDGCYSFSQLFDITQQALEAWNPVLGPNGANCTTEFFAGYYYCIGVESPSSTITTSASMTPTSAATPSPVQSGIDPSCTKYAEAVSGDYCSSFASNNGITPAQLYTWNPVLGNDGENCSSKFWANEYYCVGAPSGSGSSTPTTTSAAPVATPSPTQSGMASNCNAFAKVVSGDTCDSFAQENDITPADLYTWNTVLGTNGANCGTELYAGYYYCIGVSGTSN